MDETFGGVEDFAVNFGLGTRSADETFGEVEDFAVNFGLGTRSADEKLFSSRPLWQCATKRAPGGH